MDKEMVMNNVTVTCNVCPIVTKTYLFIFIFNGTTLRLQHVHLKSNIVNRIKLQISTAYVTKLYEINVMISEK